MPTPEEMAEAIAKAKADAATEPEPPVTDKDAIEAALADTVEELPDDSLVGLMNQAGELLRKYNGVITDIPRTSEYWSLMNRINALRNP